jgi:putative colanic acid biosynthesis acetyltransferase WcaF
MSKTDLSRYSTDFQPGSFWKRFLWFYCNAIILNSYLLPFASLKRMILRLFGAKIGKAVNIKPKVNVKYPWLLEIGNYAWVGEGVWIDNLALVKIGANACVSQGALLLTGNHNYKKPTFDLMTGPITIDEGAWIGAKAIVCPGIKVHSHAILTVGSVATKDLDPYTIYSGNPAIKVKERTIGE